MLNRRVTLLWTMMLLQYAIWGSWGVTLGGYIVQSKDKMGLGLSAGWQGLIMSLLPLACIVITPIAGQLADRKFNAEKLMGVLHLSSAVTLFALWKVQDPSLFFWLVLLHCVFYAPTLAISNSIVFANVSDSTKGFGPIRVAGTIGWIIAGLLLSQMRLTSGQQPGDFFVIGAAASLILGVLCFWLPATPPTRAGADPFAFRQALGLLKNRNFLVFMVCAFIVGTELEFYYIHTYSFLTASVANHGMGISENAAPGVMTIGQWAEIVVMLALPLLIAKLGIRKTILLGVIAWPTRYLIFTLAPTNELAHSLVVPSLALHGFCYVCFFVAGFIYVDRVAPTAIRSSAQALIALVVLGLGRWVGSFIASGVQGAYTTAKGGADGADLVLWEKVFLVPTVLTIIAAIIFPLLFRGGNEDEGSKIDINQSPTHA